ncbi:hypothetical protein [Marinisporobacter balticus]|uniref:Uncharacterized protein n=1 Tax=Marinisporobacter balticus TaxID=2018667 RepID=A0A4R2L2Y1_9FIRM|nr:hypothetical protein [Marinisporobacter balticus]TCO80022.1 hypothetical protein EV214_101259 [Marinisporobacter balticus]
MTEKKSKTNFNHMPFQKSVHFKWGGTTSDWEEEAAQMMDYLQDQLDDQESQEEKEKKIEYGTQKQYW